MEQIQIFDSNIIFFINNYLSNIPIIQNVFDFITTLGNGGIIWIIIASVLIFYRKTRLFGIFLIIGLLFGSIIGNNILKSIFKRERPFIEYEFLKIWISKPAGYSFPSGHSLSSFLAATMLFKKNKKYGIYFLFLAFLIAISRVILMVHYPTDVLIGSILGMLLGIIFFKLYEKYKVT